MILAGDVGATKILLEAGELRSGRWEAALSKRYAIVDYANIGEVLGRFLEELAAVNPRARLTAGAIGIAGPVVGNKGKMTNRPWSFDGEAIARRFGMKRVTILNDLAASARGILAVSAREMITVQVGRPLEEAPRVVIGVGTGLGTAYLLPEAKGGYRVVPGEGGHVGFSPASPRELQLWRALFAVHGRVEVEHVVSGMGMSNIYEVVRRQGTPHVGDTQKAEPAWIVDGALGRGDETCRLALDLFVECLGNIAGDQALACMARGGVYIAGGVAAKIAPLIKSPRFLSAFCAKGPFNNFMLKVPVKVVTTERLPVIGAALSA